MKECLIAYLAPPVMSMVLFRGGFALSGVRVYGSEAMTVILNMGHVDGLLLESVIHVDRLTASSRPQRGRNDNLGFIAFMSVRGSQHRYHHYNDRYVSP